MQLDDWFQLDHSFHFDNSVDDKQTDTKGTVMAHRLWRRAPASAADPNARIETDR